MPRRPNDRPISADRDAVPAHNLGGRSRAGQNARYRRTKRRASDESGRRSARTTRECSGVMNGGSPKSTPRRAGASADPEVRAEKITRERAAGAMASRKGDPGSMVARMAAKTTPPVTAWREIDQAQDEYVERVIAEWNGERKALQEAKAVLQKNAELISAHLSRRDRGRGSDVNARAPVWCAGESGADRRRRQGGGERLSARWERERAVRERERAQREREASERARGRP